MRFVNGALGVCCGHDCVFGASDTTPCKSFEVGCALEHEVRLAGSVPALWPSDTGSGVNAPWSHPNEASFPAGVEKHVAIPVQPPQPLKQLGQVTLCLTSASAVDAFSATASALYILQAFNASQLACPHMHNADMSRLLTTGSTACHSSHDLES